MDPLRARGRCHAGRQARSDGHAQPAASARTTRVPRDHRDRSGTRRRRAGRAGSIWITPRLGIERRMRRSWRPGSFESGDIAAAVNRMPVLGDVLSLSRGPVPLADHRSRRWRVAVRWCPAGRDSVGRRRASGRRVARCGLRAARRVGDPSSRGRASGAPGTPGCRTSGRGDARSARGRGPDSMSNRSLDGDLTCIALSGDRTIARFKKTLRFIEAARRESSYIDRSRDRIARCS